MKKETLKQKDGHPLVLFLGMRGRFSYPPLAALLTMGIPVCGVLLSSSEFETGMVGPGPLQPLTPPPPTSDLPLLNPFVDQNILHLAWANDIPVWAVRDLKAAESLAQIEALAPDVAVVACFPRIIPPAMLQIPPAGFLNLHPSMLPAYRGPEPLFWLFRNNDQAASGVTLHRMDEGLDSGEIIARAPLPLIDGVSAAVMERACAQLGGEMLLNALDDLSRGRLGGRPQPEGGSYYGAPQAADFSLDRSWPAQRAFNFMRGTADWGQPYSLQVDGREWLLARAVQLWPQARQEAPLLVDGDRVLVQFSPGVLEASLAL